MLVVNKPFFSVSISSINLSLFPPLSLSITSNPFCTVLRFRHMYSCVCNLGISKVLYDAAQAELVHILFSRSSDQAARQEPYSLTSANTTLNISRILAIEKL